MIPPSRATLDWVASAVGAPVAAVRPLAGGRWHENHVVSVGDGREFVLRRWARANWRSEDPEFTPEREARVLRAMEAAAVRTPRAIAVGPDLLLTDRLPGRRPPRRPRDMGSFLEQLAGALAAIHAVDADLPDYERYHEAVAVPAAQPWQQAAAMAAEPPPRGRTCTIHRDYHPGNTLWSGGRLSGVVDWTQGSHGPAAVDYGHMRWNLALEYGLGAADAFLGLVEPGDDQGYWDVVTVLDVLPDAAPGDVPRLERYLEHVLAG